MPSAFFFSSNAFHLETSCFVDKDRDHLLFVVVVNKSLVVIKSNCYLKFLQLQQCIILKEKESSSYEMVICDIEFKAVFN